LTREGGVLFRRGEVVRTVPLKELAAELLSAAKSFRDT